MGKAFGAYLITSCLMVGCATEPLAPAPLADREESLFVLGVAIAAASDVAEADALKGYGLLMPQEHSVDQNFRLRSEVKRAVKAWPVATKKELLAQFVRHPSYSSIYNAFFLETLGPPPRFVAREQGASTKGNPTFRHVYEARHDWQKLLANVYAENELRNLWRQSKPAWLAAQPHPARVEQIKQMVMGYMRLGQAAVKDLPRYTVVVSPLASPGNGGNIFVKPDDVVLVVGPADPQSTEVIIAHEFMHQPVSQMLLDKNYQIKSPRVKAALQDSECAMKRVKNNLGYVVWWNYATEALIRAASNRMIGGRAPTGDFMYEKEFSRMLDAYEKTPSQTFEEFFVESLLALRRHCN